MIAFPNGKINIGLNIIGKRPDGYHDLQTVFYPIAVKDAIEVIAQQAQQDQIIFSASGNPVQGEIVNNLSVKAFQLLKDKFPQIPPVKMHLHKVIPMGAGLGGGSADAAFVLILLNKKFGLGLSDQELSAFALQLGSDCPFFVHNKPCYATGRGENLEEIQLDLSSFKILLVHPGLHISTAEAFASISTNKPTANLKSLVQLPPASWKGMIQNDFENNVSRKHPEIKNIKEQLYTYGAVYASMSGSGSTVYGLFEKGINVVQKFPAHYFCRWV